MTLRKRLATFCVALTLLSFGVRHSQAAGKNEQTSNKDRALTVLTRNMYLGTDFDEIFAAQSQEELVAEVAEAYAEVQAGNVSERVAAIADEIAATQPDLIGLQEVALWQIGPFLDPAPATTTTFDFLQLLLDELAARGLNYAPVSVLTNFEAEAPAFFDPTLAFDVRFTDRLVVLARIDLKTSQLKLEDVEAQHFATNLSFFNPFLGQLTIPRGWIAVDVKLRGKTYRFVNTHLESFSPLVQLIQANELLQTATNTELPVVLAGDFNSDAETNEPSYQLLVSAGFLDAWEVTHPNEPGFTWPLFLVNPFTYVTPTQRLDLVLIRGQIEALATDIVGEENVTPSSPMPSDHAGVVATLRVLP
jgi:endonuclease/exonuclease/phosphatase family metal-dependent hydrolase